ncbi:MAG: sodium/solute symporter [bacterium]|nr:sodium/solute symporter [bacterium]
MPQPDNPFGAIDWLVIAAYMGVMILIGLAASRKQEDEETFFLGGRRMPTWAVSLSVLATSLSAATFIGVPQITFTGDLTYLILNLGGLVAAFIVAYLFIPPIYRAGTVTVYGYLGRRFGPSAAVAASGMFLLGRMLASGARLFIAAIAFSLMLYGDTSTNSLIAAVVIFGVVGTVYTMFGGIKAVIWTDVLQIVVVVFAAVLSITLLMKMIPIPLGEIVATLRNADGQDKLKLVDTTFSLGLPYTIWSGIIAGTFVTTAAYGVDYDMAQRMFTTKSPARGGAALIVSQLLTVPVVLLFMAIGLLLSIYYGRPDLMGDAAPLEIIDDTKKVYPQFLLYHLPVGLRGLSMAGLIAAAMSSFDSAINAMAATAVSDIYIPLFGRRHPESDRRALHAPRAAVVLMGALLILFAIAAVFMQSKGNDTLLNFALGVMAFAHAPLLGVFAVALFTRRGNVTSVMAALATGVIAVLLLQPYMLPKLTGIAIAWPWWWVIVSPLSFVVCLVGKGSTSKSATEAY